MHHKMQFPPELFEQLDVATATVAESERAPHAEAVHVTEIADQLPYELFTWLLAEGPVEVNQQRHVDPKRFHHSKLLGRGIDQGRIPFRRDHRIGMTIKRDGQSQCLMLPGIFDRLPEDLLVPEMHAIKHA